MLTTYCLTLDLKDEPQLIEQYKEHHKPGQVWSEVVKSIKDSGIESMEIYLLVNRLVMVMVVNESFSFTAKRATDEKNGVVQKWEQLMSTYQQPLPWATSNEKWLLMDEIFSLAAQ